MKSLINSFLIGGLLLNGWTVKAGVIVLGNTSQIEDFKDHLQKNPEQKSLNDALIERKIKKGNDTLEDKYALAVKGLTMSDLKPSLFLFKEISSYPKNSFIFSDKKIELVTESFYRLSNLDRNNAEYWIKNGLLHNPDYSPSDEIFNPNILEKYNTLKSQLEPHFYKLSVSDFTPSWSVAFVNGQRADGVLKVHPTHKYNLQVFKNGFQPFEGKILGENLINSKEIALSSWDLGRCKKPKLKNKLSGIEIDFIYYSGNCILNLKTQKQKLTQNQSSKPKEIKIFPDDKVTPTPSEDTLVKQNTEDKKGLFQRKSTWYVIVGAAVLTTLAISLSQNNNDPEIVPVQHDQ